MEPDILTWSLDDMLAESKKKQMKIHHDYDTRFRVWDEQILVNRYYAIMQTNGDKDFINRMITLVIKDYDKLIERASTEFVINNDMDRYKTRTIELSIVTKKTIELYKGEIK